MQFKFKKGQQRFNMHLRFSVSAFVLATLVIFICISTYWHTFPKQLTVSKSNRITFAY